MTTYTGSDLLLTVNSFVVGAETLSFYGTNASATFIPGKYDTQSSTTNSAIMLPNGAKYDPNQTYDAPNPPGEITVNVQLKPLYPSDQEDTERSIASYYNFNLVMFLGKRGTLSGAQDYPFGYILPTATARLIQMSLDWELPKQISTALGGGGNTTPGIKVAVVRFRFDLITKWTFTI